MKRKSLQLMLANLRATMFSHLRSTHMNYFQHLLHAWRMAGILIVHGLIPWVWETKVSQEILDYENSVSKSKR